MSFINSTAHPDLQAAHRVLQTEIEGLQALGSALGNQFIQTMDKIISLKGHVIVSGMGKSGHIAKKIAATLSSTGTPAFFVHPGEASHGDLGMITERDLLLLLSNSGETKELQDMTCYAKRYGIPLIAVVRRQNSALVEAADIAFILPAIPEASHVNAPTTSTTIMLALGDALAIALLERKGFTREHYHEFHPGGKLGASFTKVSTIMHSGDALPSVMEWAPMSDVLLQMTSKRFGCTAVINEDGLLSGIVTDGDLRRHMSSRLLQSQAQDIMTKNPVVIRPNALVEEAINIMNSHSITVLFVVEDGRVCGILHVHDCLRVK